MKLPPLCSRDAASQNTHIRMAHHACGTWSTCPVVRTTLAGPASCSRGAGGTDATGTSSAASPAGVRGIGMVRKVSANVLCVSTIFCRDWLEQQWGAHLQSLLLPR